MKKGLSILRLGRLLKKVTKYLKDADVPKYKKLLFVFPIIYIIIPVDLVSDFLPIFGWLDDAAILTVVWNFFLQELRDYELDSGSTSTDDETQKDEEKDYTLDEDDYRIE